MGGDEEKIRQLVRKRKTKIDDLNRCYQFVQNYTGPDIYQLTTRLELVKDLWSEFKIVQAEIEELDVITETQADFRESFETKYCDTIASIKGKQAMLTKPPQSCENTNRKLANVRLPTIKLPEFSGAYSDFKQFHDTFDAVINKDPDLTNAARFYYLDQCLKGKARQVIADIPADDDNYEAAWQLLKGRYDNKRVIVNSHIKLMLEIPSIPKESAILLRQLSDGLVKGIRCLKNLNLPVDTWDTLLIYLMSAKLDLATKRKWESSIKSSKLPTMDEFTTFLSEECLLLEALQTNAKGTEAAQKPKSFREKTLSHHTSQNLPCPLCKSNHAINHCKVLLELSPKNRLAEIKNRKLCINCLKSGHSVISCPSSSCRNCNKRHHTLLHFNEANQQIQSTTSQSNATSSNEPSVTISAHSQKRGTSVMLSTAIVYINDKHNNPVKCRALLDSGSQSNFMTQELVNKLDLPTTKLDICVSGINQTTSLMTRRTQTSIKSVYNGYCANLSFLLVPKITENLPLRSFSRDNFSIPDSIKLADPCFYKSNEVDILIGAGIFFDLLCVGQIKLGALQPIIQKTKLGWIVSGPMSIQQKVSATCMHSTIVDLQSQLEKFWTVEEYAKKRHFTKDEILCEQHFTNTVQRDPTGRFTVKLPTRNNIAKLGDTKEIATKRFLRLEHKLEHDKDLRRQYNEFLQEYEDLGHMSKIPESELISANVTNYLPHHGVVKESSVTTKLRVVFDASAKSSSGLSLNDALYVGPNLQDDIFAILIRFRKYNYVMMADIAKMYRQINVDINERDLQRIIWRPNPNEPLCDYRLNTVTYGTASASFLAIRCLQQLALDNRDEFPEASQTILKDFYVDDLITGANDITTARTLKHDISHILMQAGFELRKWITNNSSILEDLNTSNAIMPHYHISDNNATKTLGISWNPNADTLLYAVNINTSKARVTKRTILSAISQIFDPLGLVGPVIIRTKILLQAIWKLKIDWDESIPIDIYTTWTRLLDQLPLLNKISIPRQATLRDSVNIQLHGFADASEAAYGACIYLRSTDHSGKVHIELLCAKSRVAPLKTISLPRLELCANLLLAQLVSKVSDIIDMHINEYFYWTDSTITLAWIAAEPTEWKTFVANRVAEIQQLTQGTWNHISSSENPADIISRGLFPEQLLNSSLWWNGPNWLKAERSHWPDSSITEINDLSEKRNTTVAHVAMEKLPFLSKFSSLTKLTRVTAYVLRFISNLRPSSTKTLGPLTCSEVEKAQKTLIILVQNEVFHGEIHDLERSKSVSRTSKLLPLNPFLHNGIIHVGGRLKHANLPYKQRHPIVLPHNHHFTTLLIRNEHNKLMHAGPQAVLASIRQTYWPINGRSIVKKALRSCVTCFRARPIHMSNLMGDLPASRLCPARPFLSCGIDCAGPFLVKDGKTRNRKLVKAYVCLFVCFSTKATHLELIGDLSTDTFLNALKRFVARRGMPKNIYSDNGTNFVGANNKLMQTDESLTDMNDEASIRDWLLENRVIWHFIPPRSPHFGGLWEAAIKSCKFHLIRVLGHTHLNFEQFTTVLTQVESILNSRPLSPISSDPNDLTPLTPGHFLIGTAFTTLPAEDVTDIHDNRLSKYEHLQKLIQHFWQRWSKEYLSTLQQRTRWKKHQTEPVVRPGDLVILKEDNTPPLKWNLARIIDIHPGNDGITRVVTVKSAHGITKRAITRICVLPVDTTTPQE